MITTADIQTTVCLTGVCACRSAGAREVHRKAVRLPGCPRQPPEDRSAAAVAFWARTRATVRSVSRTPETRRAGVAANRTRGSPRAGGRVSQRRVRPRRASRQSSSRYSRAPRMERGPHAAGCGDMRTTPFGPILRSSTIGCTVAGRPHQGGPVVMLALLVPALMMAAGVHSIPGRGSFLDAVRSHRGPARGIYGRTCQG